MIRPVRTVLSTFPIAARRLWAARWLGLAGAVGLVAVVALALSVPLYADAVYHRTLLTTIADAEVDQQGIRRPPFTFMFRYAGKFDGPLDWQTIMPADQFMANQVPGMLGLPRQLMARYFETRLGQLFPLTDTAYLSKREPLVWTSVATMGDLTDHVDVIDGRLPASSQGGGADSPIQVMVSQAMANKLGLQVGEPYLLFFKPGDADPIQLPVIVTGLWKARDPAEPFWFSHPESLNETLLTPEPIFTAELGSRVPGEVFLAVWYMVFDGTGVRSEHVTGMLDRIKLTTLRATQLLARVKLDISPVGALEDYQATSRLLTVQLLAINVPILLLMFAYTLLVSSLLVGGRRNEIAVLRSRGASIVQILGIAFLEACVLGALAVVVGSVVAEFLAYLVGQTRSFLNFTGGGAASAPLQIVITQSSLAIALVIALVAVLMTLFPTVSAAQHTVITYKQERARNLRAPWWQRAWVDVLLMIPAAYGTYMLQKQGSLVLPSAIGTGAVAPADPFNNPLLFMVPVLAILAITLFLIRLMPHVLRLVAAVLGRLPGAAMVMAARQLSRSPGFYAAPMLLLVLTLGMATFTASLAATLDQHLLNEIRYAIGADMRLDEMGESTRDTSTTSPGEGAAQTSDDSTPSHGPLFTFLPVEDHLKVDGVLGAARAAGYRAEAHFSTRNASASYLGIDRLDYGRVAYWRSDFATQPLGTLMNFLAARYDGVLVPESVLAENALQIGDPVRVVVALKDGAVALDLTIVGAFKLWPGWNPKMLDSGPLFVGNLDYLFEQAGGQVPYEVMLKLRPGTDPEKVVAGVSKLRVAVHSYHHAQSRIDLEQTRPARQGLFGMLSVGFGAAGVFTVLGFFLYAVFSLRRRTIELGVMRAIGFSAGQMAAFLGSELALLLGVGMGAGTLLGVLASRLYIPYFQLSASEEGRALPFAVVVSWPDIYRIYMIFGLLFVVALIALVLLLRRMRIFEAVKLGESE
jgi:putative ABC transport system permease protein